MLGCRMPVSLPTFSSSGARTDREGAGRLAASCALLLTGLAACDTRDAPKPSWIALPTVIGDGSRVELIGMDSGLCLEVGGSGYSDRDRLQLSTCNQSSRQQFRFDYKGEGHFRLMNWGSSKCVDVDSASTEPLADIFQWTCGDTANQQLLVKNFGNLVQFQARHSGLCLDVKSAGKEAGTPLIQWPCTEAANQRFLVRNVEPSRPRR